MPTRTAPLLAALLLLGCARGLGNAPAAMAPATPTDGAARCKVAASHESPLVTEWPAADKARLEAAVSRGTVAVSYSGCELRVLPDCQIPGRYAFQRTTPASDQIRISNADELFAKLPLGAASLEGELARSGALAMDTTVSGQLLLDGYDPRGAEQAPACRGATHVITSLAVGAFELRTGAASSTSASAGAAGVGALGGGTRETTASLRRAGSPARCAEAAETAPHPDCASPLQVFLRPLPATLAARGPEGKIRARFLPLDPRQEWDVLAADSVVCRAPCERWIDPHLPYSLRYDPGIFNTYRYAEVPSLATSAGAGPVLVGPDPGNGAAFAGGIVAAALGGVALLGGTMGTAFGCRDRGSTGGCVAGVSALVLGAAGVTAGVLLIVGSGTSVTVTPLPADAPPLRE